MSSGATVKVTGLSFNSTLFCAGYAPLNDNNRTVDAFHLTRHIEIDMN